MINVADQYFLRTGNPAHVFIENRFETGNHNYGITLIIIHDILNNKKITITDGDANTDIDDKYWDLYEIINEEYSKTPFCDIRNQEIFQTTTLCRDYFFLDDYVNAGEAYFNFANNTFFNPEYMDTKFKADEYAENYFNASQYIDEFSDECVINWIQAHLSRAFYENKDMHHKVFVELSIENGKLTQIMEFENDEMLQVAIDEFNKRLEDGSLVIEEPENFSIASFPL